LLDAPAESKSRHEAADRSGEPDFEDFGREISKNLAKKSKNHRSPKHVGNPLQN
jgi:hypothetical protein